MHSKLVVHFAKVVGKGCMLDLVGKNVSLQAYGDSNAFRGVTVVSPGLPAILHLYSYFRTKFSWMSTIHGY
jgi:hypothetical protein